MRLTLVFDEDYFEELDSVLEKLCNACRHGKSGVLDCYGTTNMAELFAVATEAFFERPRDLTKSWPFLFSVMRRFYRQDPETGFFNSRSSVASDKDKTGLSTSTRKVSDG
jgi:Mlc titration factor MtfA (ptsG expression regulator)